MVINWNKLPLVLALGSAIAVTSVVAYGNRGEKPASVTPQAQSVQLSADQNAAILAQAGRSAMSYMGAAQHGIAINDTGLAAKNLETARDRLGQMQELLDSDAASEGNGLVPIFAQVGIAQDVEVTDELKDRLQALGPHVLKGEHQRAAAIATAPGQLGTAHFRLGDFAQALELFSAGMGPDAHYNRGNTLARLGRYEDAIAAYGQALSEQPGMEDAGYNKTLLEALLREQQQQSQSAGGQLRRKFLLQYQQRAANAALRSTQPW